jgi:hypothetical protein
LTASCNLSANTPIIECKGKLMLSSQFRSTGRAAGTKGHTPYVFFYHLGDQVPILFISVSAEKFSDKVYPGFWGKTPPRISIQ